MGRILLRQKELEENNERFMKNENDVKRDLKNLDITDSTYEQLCRQDEDMLTIREYVSVIKH